MAVANQGQLRKRTEGNFVDSKMLTLILAMLSMIMIFAGFTSAYLVSKGDMPWLEIELPQAFTISTILIIFSSISMHWSYISAKKNEIRWIKVGLGITMLLGFGFLWSQLSAYEALVADKHYLVGNPASSYIYVISGTHAAHIIGGLVFLIATFVAAMRYKIHSKALRRIQMCTYFWHFLGGLWIYLYFFFQLNG